MNNDDLKADCHKYLDMLWHIIGVAVAVVECIAQKLTKHTPKDENPEKGANFEK